MNSDRKVGKVMKANWCEILNTVVVIAVAVVGAIWSVYVWISKGRAHKAKKLSDVLERVKGGIGFFYAEVEGNSGFYLGDLKFKSPAFKGKLCELMTDLSYVCYLRENKLIADKELYQVLYVIKKLLSIKDVRQYLYDLRVTHKMGCDSLPFSNLIRLSGRIIVDEKVEELSEMWNAESFNNDVVDESKDCICEEGAKQCDILKADNSCGNKWKTHVSILNGLFGKNLKGHMQGGYRLDVDNIVWFPHYVVSDVRPRCENADQWVNWISKNGKSMFEGWPACHVAPIDFDRRRRYVFGKLKGDAFYRFLGVFAGVGIDNESRSFKYERVTDQMVPFNAKTDIKGGVMV